MKPLLGQLQNQPSLDELLGSSKSVGGNFDRVRSSEKTRAENKSPDTSFSNMLLSTIENAHASKSASKFPVPRTNFSVNKSPAQRLPIDPASLQNQSGKMRSLTDSTAREAARQDREYSQKAGLTKKDGPLREPSFDALERDSFESKSSTDAMTPTVRPRSKQAPTVENRSISQETTAAINGSQGVQKSVHNLATNPPDATVAAQNAMDAQTSSESLGLGSALNPAEAKSALSPLKNLMSGPSSPEALLNRNAVLAFVSGRLEKLDPESLPALITDSALIKQALASGDIAKFMQTPMAIGELANLVELDQGLLNKASQAGLDPNKMVTPKDFINALGLDAGRITSELTILQQKLPSDGVAAYVQRARALITAANNSTKATTKGINQDSNGSKINKDGTDLLNASMAKISPADSTTKVLAEDLDANMEISVASDLARQQSASFGSIGQTRANSLNGGLHQNGANAPQKSIIATNDPAEMLSVQGFSPLTQLNATGNSSGQSLVENLSQVDQPIPDDGQLLDSITSEVNSTYITQDPYHEIGKMLDSNTSMKIDFGGDGISQRSLEEHLLAKGLNTSLIKNEGLMANSSGLEPMKLIKDAENSNAGIDFGRDLQANMQQENLATNQTIKDLPLPSEAFSDRESSNEQSSSLFSEQASDVSANILNGKSEIRDSGDVFTNKLAEGAKAASKDSVASKILGHAQMMIKNGGGSMRVDVEAPGIGKVDVAISLINNQLDVRIITATEQARDMISKEVAGLRDGLTQQGINLRGLEVGKAGESSPRHFTGNGQQFGQGSQDQRASYSDMREYAQNFRNSYAPRIERAVSSKPSSISRWSNGAIPTVANGRLEVRV